MLIFCHSVLLQLWGQSFVGISALQVAAIRCPQISYLWLETLSFLGVVIITVTYVMSIELTKVTLLEKGLVSWNYVKHQFGLVVSQFKQVLVLSASTDSCLLSLQMITCICIQNYTAHTCDLYQFSHPGVTVLCMWMWKWWSGYLFGAYSTACVITFCISLLYNKKLFWEEVLEFMLQYNLWVGNKGSIYHHKF